MRNATQALCSLLLLAQGCIPLPDVADREQRKCTPRPGRLDPDTVRRPSGRVVTKVVQLTDDGELVDRCGLSDALLELNARAKDDRTKPDPRRLTVLVYIHGWKHDGQPGDNDRQSFQALASRIADRQRRDSSRVVGIYVAWNGRRAVLPVVKELTFWGRKQAADRVSQSAAVTRLLGAVDNILRQRANPDDIVVYVGHSFGARMLFTAVSQVLIHRVQLEHPGRRNGTYGRIDGPGNLVVLVNPAFEASVYTSLDVLRRYEESFQSDQRPVLVTIASENDRATQLAFPAGQLFSLNWRPRVLTALGNYAPYRTHVLRTASPGDFAMSDGEDRFCSVESQVCLERIDTIGSPTNPFIVARADKSIVSGHNGIWGERFVSFLTEFIVANATR